MKEGDGGGVLLLPADSWPANTGTITRTPCTPTPPVSCFNYIHTHSTNMMMMRPVFCVSAT